MNFFLKDSLEKFKNDAERDLIFHHRRWCKEHPDSLPWLLRSIDWCNREAVAQIHKYETLSDFNKACYINNY
jgi:hypothetical protein